MTLGVDVGHERIKAVVFSEGCILASTVFRASGPVDSLGVEAWNRIRKANPRLVGPLPRMFITGVGRERVEGCEGRPSEVLCQLVGARFWNPYVRTVVDLGAEGTRVIKGDALGRPLGFKLNDRCGAGTGVFLETVASMLGITIEQMGEKDPGGLPSFSITTTCAVFAESEIVGHIHRGACREEIISAVHDAVGAKVASMVRSIAPEPEVMLTGGLARDRALVERIQRYLGVNLMVPPEPELTGAIGAAILAQRGEFTQEEQGG